MKTYISLIFNTVYKNLLRDAFLAFFITLSLFGISQINSKNINNFLDLIKKRQKSTIIFLGIDKDYLLLEGKPASRIRRGF
jgi:hypothetical protein